MLCQTVQLPGISLFPQVISFAFVQVTVSILPVDDPPVADDLDIVVYSGRSTQFSLPAYDPDGTRVDIFILNEPVGGNEALQLTEETVVSMGSQRRKVHSISFASLETQYSRSFKALARALHLTDRRA